MNDLIDYTYFRENLVNQAFPFDFTVIHSNYLKALKEEEKRLSNDYSKKEIKAILKIFSYHLKVEAPNLKNSLYKEILKEIKPKTLRKKLYWIKEVIFAKNLTKLAYI